MPKRNLTKRETDILNLKMSGLSDKEIAANLSISYWTVRQHIDNIKIKFNCQNLYQAIWKANFLNIDEPVVLQEE